MHFPRRFRIWALLEKSLQCATENKNNSSSAIRRSELLIALEKLARSRGAAKSVTIS